MQKITLKSLRFLRRVIKNDPGNFGRNWKLFSNKYYSNKLISEALMGEEPCMIARLGSTETNCIVNYLGVSQQEKFKTYSGFIDSKTPMWWWDTANVKNMNIWSGFFPCDLKNIERFCELMIECMPDVDILGSWLRQETFFENQFHNAKKVMLEDLEPFFSEKPWTQSLLRKKVLVVHPFADSILSQYSKREKIFPDGLLPEFELTVLKAVQTVAGEQSKFKTWFDALEFMKGEIVKINFDICIIGCGAYGFPLASFVKGMGKKAIHMGGVTQLMFGVLGKRWEKYEVFPYQNLFNEYWVRPNASETPKRAHLVENSSYW